MVWYGVVTLQFVAVGNAPLMKRTKFTVSGHDQLSVVGEMCFWRYKTGSFGLFNCFLRQVYRFLRKQLRLKDTESLVSTKNRTDTEQLLAVFSCWGLGLNLSKHLVQFVYCNSSFAPSPDQRLSSLFQVLSLPWLLVAILFCTRTNAVMLIDYCAELFDV